MYVFNHHQWPQWPWLSQVSRAGGGTSGGRPVVRTGRKRPSSSGAPTVLGGLGWVPGAPWAKLWAPHQGCVPQNSSPRECFGFLFVLFSSASICLFDIFDIFALKIHSFPSFGFFSFLFVCVLAGDRRKLIWRSERWREWENRGQESFASPVTYNFVGSWRGVPRSLIDYLGCCLSLVVTHWGHGDILLWVSPPSRLESRGPWKRLRALWPLGQLI